MQGVSEQRLPFEGREGRSGGRFAFSEFECGVVGEVAAKESWEGGNEARRTESSSIRRRSRRHFDPNNNETCALIYEGNFGYTRPSYVAFNRRRSG